MANYLPFPSSGAPGGQYMGYGAAPPAPQPTGNGAAAGGYGVYPTSNQVLTNPGGAPMQPGSPRPGTHAYMNMRLPDGTVNYVPVVAQMVGDRMQWIATGPGTGQPALQASPRGGEMIPTQRTGGQAAYPDPYRSAERDSGSTDRKWYQPSKKEKSSKKSREWEKEARAREEAEERQRIEIAERERIRKMSNTYEKARRASVSADAQPAGILHHSTSGPDLNQRFGSMGLGPNGPYQSASVRSRRPSTSEGENPYQRARRLSTGVPPDGPTGGDPTRQRRPSGNYGAPTTPASAVSAFYPDRERAYGRGEYEPGHGRSPSGGYPLTSGMPGASYVAPDGSGRMMGGGMVVGPGGQMMPSYLPPNMTGALTTSPNTRSAIPMSFYREPSKSAPYSRFDPFSILWDLGDFRKFSPPLPALLVACDVQHDDWNRCMGDLNTAWTGVLPYNIFDTPGKQQQKSRQYAAATPASSNRQLVRPSSAVAKTIDIWNASFFYGRKLELILYRGLERRSGLTAGRKSERLKRDQFPPQFQPILYGRKGRRHHDSEDETDDESDESLTSSSESDSSSSDAESFSDDDDRSDEEPAYVTKQRKAVGSHQPYQMSRSRRNSLAAHGQLPTNPGLDVHEMWAVKSREAVKVIRARQKVEKKRRKLERRMKRRELRGEPLYSLWIVHL